MNGAARDQEFGGVTLLDLGLGKDAPQVWRAILANVPLPPDGSWMRVLQADERARIQAFQFPQLQRDFAVTRWVLPIPTLL